MFIGPRVMYGSTILRVYSKGARRWRILPRRGVDMHGFCRPVVPPCTYLLPSWQRRRFRLPCALRRCSSRRPLKVHVYRSACDVWVNDSSRLFKRSSATANSAAPWCRHARTLSWQRRRFRLPCILRRCSSQRPFIFLGSRVMSDVPMILRGLFEVSSATADSAAPWCRHAHICCHRGNGDAFDCRALCDAALHDGL